MNLRLTSFCLLVFGLPIVGRSDDGIAKLIEQFNGISDEAEKSEFVTVINRAMRDQIRVSQSNAVDVGIESNGKSDQVLVAKTFRHELESAESLELVNMLAHSW